MALTVRLSPKTERTLDALAKRRRVSRSDVVREALAQYGANQGDDGGDDGPYAAWLDVLGVVDLGARDPSGTTGEQYTALVTRPESTVESTGNGSPGARSSG